MPVGSPFLTGAWDTGKLLFWELLDSENGVQPSIYLGVGTEKNHRGQDQGSMEDGAEFECSPLADTPVPRATCGQVRCHEGSWFPSFQWPIGLPCKICWCQKVLCPRSIDQWYSFPVHRGFVTPRHSYRKIQCTELSLTAFVYVRFEVDFLLWGPMACFLLFVQAHKSVPIFHHLWLFHQGTFGRIHRNPEVAVEHIAPLPPRFQGLEYVAPTARKPFCSQACVSECAKHFPMTSEETQRYIEWPLAGLHQPVLSQGQRFCQLEVWTDPYCLQRSNFQRKMFYPTIHYGTRRGWRRTCSSQISKNFCSGFTKRHACFEIGLIISSWEGKRSCHDFA